MTKSEPERLTTNILVLDELLYVSKKRYHVPYEVTSEFISSSILPFTEVLTLDLPEYKIAIEVIEETGLKPSDAIHIASMIQNNISTIASEDHELDHTSTINRIWPDDRS
ncbi:MAG: type II toxin-antitoxin system VapC family toxin [Candidatus Bathyarchaeia archaeon]